MNEKKWFLPAGLIYSSGKSGNNFIGTMRHTEFSIGLQTPPFPPLEQSSVISFPSYKKL